MRKSLSKIFTAVLSLTVLCGAVASADSLNVQLRAEAEMYQGKDYVAAWQSAMRAAEVGVYPRELIAKAKNAESQMNQGKDYHAAWATSAPATDPAYAKQQMARAKGN